MRSNNIFNEVSKQNETAVECVPKACERDTRISMVLHKISQRSLKVFDNRRFVFAKNRGVNHF